MPAFGRYITILLASILLATVVAPEVMAQSEAELKAARRQLAPTIVDLVADEQVGDEAPVRIRWVNTATDATSFDVLTTTREILPPVTHYDFGSLPYGTSVTISTGSTGVVGWIAAGWICPVIARASLAGGGISGQHARNYIAEGGRIALTTGLGDGQGATAAAASRFDSLHSPGYLAGIPGPDYRMVAMLYIYEGIGHGNFVVAFARDATTVADNVYPNLPRSPGEAAGDRLALEMSVPVNAPRRSTATTGLRLVAPGDSHRSVFFDFAEVDNVGDWIPIADIRLPGNQLHRFSPGMQSCILNTILPVNRTGVDPANLQLATYIWYEAMAENGLPDNSGIATGDISFSFWSGRKDTAVGFESRTEVPVPSYVNARVRGRYGSPAFLGPWSLPASLTLNALPSIATIAAGEYTQPDDFGLSTTIAAIRPGTDGEVTADAVRWAIALTGVVFCGLLPYLWTRGSNHSAALFVLAMGCTAGWVVLMPTLGGVSGPATLLPMGIVGIGGLLLAARRLV